MTARPNPDIFKAYDTRGIHGDDLDPDIAGLIGLAFTRVIAAIEGKETTPLALPPGRDMRLPAP